MAGRDSKRFLIHGAILLAMVLLARPVWKQGILDPGPRCDACRGMGTVFVEAWLPGACMARTVPRSCRVCRGSGRTPPLTRLRTAFPEIVLGFWEGVCVVAGVGLLLALRVVNCRRCAGAGRLLLVVSPPGVSSYTAEADCFDC